MRLLKENRIAKSSFFWIVLLCLMIQSGCSSVEHIRLYREARQDFSAAALADNNVTKENLFPNPNRFNDLLSSSATADLSYNRAQESMGSWDAVLREFTALNKNKESELTADALFGSSRTFQIMAQLRRDFWIHFLKAGGGQLDYPEKSKSLTEALDQAEALVKKKDVKLFERDSLLLQSLRPRVRYEIAYINASRPCPNDTILKRKTFFPIAVQMAQAEKELAEVSRTAQKNLQYYFTMSRYIMLVSARHVVFGDKYADQSKTKHLSREKADELKTLIDRVNHFREQADNLGTPENNLINSLGLTEINFKTNYLLPIVKE